MSVLKWGKYKLEELHWYLLQIWYLLINKMCQCIIIIIWLSSEDKHSFVACVLLLVCNALIRPLLYKIWDTHILNRDRWKQMESIQKAESRLKQNIAQFSQSMKTAVLKIC